MLKHIPFYASLLGRQMSSGKKSNNGMVLVYGAIEVHAMGEKGCIASNRRIAQETGLSSGTVANYISEMNKSGWVKVNTKTVNGGITRINIEPLLTIQTPSRTSETLHTSMIPPSSGDDTPLHLGVNIGNSIGNKENTGESKDSGAKASKEDEEQISVLYYKVIKELELPNSNNTVTRRKIKQMASEISLEQATWYLQFLLHHYEEWEHSYKPEINKALDIYEKRKAIIDKLKTGER